MEKNKRLKKNFFFLKEIGKGNWDFDTDNILKRNIKDKWKKTYSSSKLVEVSKELPDGNVAPEFWRDWQ